MAHLTDSMFEDRTRLLFYQLRLYVTGSHWTLLQEHEWVCPIGQLTECQRIGIDH